MMIELLFDGKLYSANLHEPLDISLPIREGVQNPNCYWADPVKFETISSGNFIGSVKAGGSVNYQKLTVTPHGNGTHCECYGHIASDGATIQQCLKTFHFFSELVTVIPEKNHGGDMVITKHSLEEKIRFKNIDALIIRTFPNEETKKIKHYSGTNPAYIVSDAIELIVSMGIRHLLVDLPSLDKELDDGTLEAHKAFWKYPHAVHKESTVTELIFVDNSISDGLYFLNLQIASLEMDASPAKPVLYKLREVL